MEDQLKNVDPSQVGQSFMFDEKDLKLCSPFKLMIAGQSGVGKTMFAQRLLELQFYSVPASEVTLCIPPGNAHVLSESIDEYRKIVPSIKVQEGIPDLSTLTHSTRQHYEHKILSRVFHIF